MRISRPLNPQCPANYTFSQSSLAMSLTPEEIAYYEANASDALRPNQIAACTCGIAFAVSAVVARMISRRRSRVKHGRDDYTICVALVSVQYLLLLLH